MVFKEGDVLVAKSVCKMSDGSGNALIIGKEYFIEMITDNIFIHTESFQFHSFSLGESDDKYWGKFFYTPMEVREQKFKELYNDK